MLRECRRALKPGGRIAFFVIHLSKGLGAEDYEQAVGAAPGNIEAPMPYLRLLDEAGFVEVTEEDVSVDYVATSRRWLEGAAKREAALRQALGDSVYEDKHEVRTRTHRAAAAGIVSRSLMTGRA